MDRPGSPRLVKKYGNRRLYDTSDSRYITLEELAERIRDGADVRVQDAKTGEDLTQATLTQIIIEGRGAARFLSVPLLTQLVRMGDDVLGDFLGRYLTASLELYVQARQGVQAVQTMGQYSPLAGLPLAATNALARLFPFGGATWPGTAAPQPPPPSAYPAPPPPEPPPPAAASESSVEQLRRELEEIKRSLAGSARGGARSATAGAKRKGRK